MEQNAHELLSCLLVWVILRCLIIEFQMCRCWMQRLAFLLRRPVILVLSVLLTATLMCVTTSPSSLAPVLHLLCLISPSSQRCLQDTSADEGPACALLMCIYAATLGWPSVTSAACVGVFFFFFRSTCLSGLNGLKIAPVAVGEEACRVAPLGGDVELNESSVRTCGTQKTEPTLFQSYWLYFFFFKTENNRFTTGLFKQTLTLNLPTPTKRYQKCTIVLIHLLKV